MIQKGNKMVRAFAGLNFKRKPLKRDLEHYELVIAGCNMGAILGRQFDHVTHGHHPTMTVLKDSINQQYTMRTIYEQQRIKKSDFLMNAKMCINTFHAHSENVPVKSFHPEENYIVLENNRRINYDYLVCAVGLEQDYAAIEGFDSAYADMEHPVFSNFDHPSWRSLQHKYPRWHYNFTNGDAFFCIPPYPFKGEISNYSFFLSKQIWDWYQAHGRLSPEHSFTIMNANDKFAQWFDQADQFIKDLLQKKQIKVEYHQQLVKVDKHSFKATFKNTQTGATQERDYNHLYSLAPARIHPGLLSSGLAHSGSNNLLDVDQYTLQHNQHKNVFGLGDVNNLPTTRTFWSAFQQIHVVRHNLKCFIEGKQVNAHYDGYSKAPLQLGQRELTYVEHYYDNKPGTFNLLGANGGILSMIRYMYFTKMLAKKFQGYYMFKNWGPPYNKFKPSWKELPLPKEEKETASV